MCTCYMHMSMTYYIYATCKLHAQSGCISCKLHLHAVANVLKISATNNYTLDHVCIKYHIYIRTHM